jgi:tetratricopeptide (TPR) repeat protein
MLAGTPIGSLLPGDRQYDELARFDAIAGRVDYARQLVAAADANDRAMVRQLTAERSWTRGVIALAEGRAREAEPLLRIAAERHPCTICALPDLARAYEAEGKRAAAAQVYERYARTPWFRRYETDALELGPVLQRLAELYDAAGELEKAASARTRLVQLWGRADTELQPAVERRACEDRRGTELMSNDGATFTRTSRASMTLTLEPEEASVADTPQRMGSLARLAAFVAGAVVLLCGIAVSLGGVVLAQIGMAVAAHVQRRRGHPLTRGGYWIAAFASMAIVILLATGVLLSSAPKGTVASVMRAADSSSAVAAKQPPPAWLERLSPGYRAQQARLEPSSRLFAVLTAIFGIGFAVTMFATLYGTLGWAAGMLFGLAAQGRWPGSPPPREERLTSFVNDVIPPPGSA